MPETKTETKNQTWKTLETYRREIAVAAALVVVIGGLYLYLRESQREAELAAATDLYKVEADAARRMGRDLDKTGADLLAVASEHPGARTRFGALVLAFAAARDDGDDAKAREAADAFLAAFPDHDFAGRVRLQLAYLHLDADRVDDARREIDALGKLTLPGLEPFVLLASAQCREHEAERAAEGSPERASLYEAAVEEYRNLELRAQPEWPPMVVILSRFSRALAEDRLAGRAHAMPPKPLLPFADDDLAGPPLADDGEGPLPAETPAGEDAPATAAPEGEPAPDAPAETAAAE